MNIMFINNNRRDNADISSDKNDVKSFDRKPKI